ncbi:MAG TPA: IS481 family transposase [Stellaceae bacterium]|nr:IS481 family transposase [Stellaceae bacterium]
MDEKLEFIADCLRGDEPMTVLCERYGISRETGYVWKRRYETEGARGLEERSRAPHRHGLATPAGQVVRIIEARRRKPYWGPKKLLKTLRDEAPDLRWPSASTVSEILRREGLSEPRRRRRRSLTADQPFAAVAGANDTWCIDFKGWFLTGDGERCDPLTVTDAYSRYILALRLMRPVTEAVEPVLDRLFREHGLPQAIRSDNGTPFASTGAGGLTRLSVHWVKLGIALERIYPGRPQQNGRHERMHKTLKAEVCTPPAATQVEQQARFEVFQREFNDERPHESLGQQSPAQFYTASSRLYPERLEDPVYGADEQVRQVRSSGEIKWQGSMYFISEALIGEAVGIRERDDGHWLVRFAEIPLVLIDRYSGKIARFGPGRPPRTKTTSET